MPAPAGACSGCTKNGEMRDVADGALLVGRQVAEVFGAHIQAAAVVGLVDHAEDAFLLGDDRVDGELLVAFAVVRLARSR